MYKVSNVFFLYLFFLFFFVLFYFSQLEKRLEMGCKIHGLNTIAAGHNLLQEWPKVSFAMCPTGFSWINKTEIVSETPPTAHNIHSTSLPLAAGVQLWKKTHNVKWFADYNVQLLLSVMECTMEFNAGLLFHRRRQRHSTAALVLSAWDLAFSTSVNFSICSDVRNAID